MIGYVIHRAYPEPLVCAVLRSRWLTRKYRWSASVQRAHVFASEEEARVHLGSRLAPAVIVQCTVQRVEALDVR